MLHERFFTFLLHYMELATTYSIFRILQLSHPHLCFLTHWLPDYIQTPRCKYRDLRSFWFGNNKCAKCYLEIFVSATLRNGNGPVSFHLKKFVSFISWTSMAIIGIFVKDHLSNQKFFPARDIGAQLCLTYSFFIVHERPLSGWNASNNSFLLIYIRKQLKNVVGLSSVLFVLGRSPSKQLRFCAYLMQNSLTFCVFISV